MQRRQFLRGASAAVAVASTGAFAANEPRHPALPPPPPDAIADHFAPPRALSPIRASADRIIALSVCTRPFRAQGPRIEAERMGRKTIVHNYGHGGSGWSLSWGSAERALSLAPAVAGDEVAVIGCGAIGLTTALVAQRAGLRVRIYAKDRVPDVRSFYATGVWSPDSRVATAAASTPEFERLWEAMARSSFRRFQTLLGLPGEPVEWRDGYFLSDVPFDQPAGPDSESREPEYADLEHRLLRDLHPGSRTLAPGEHPFPVPYARRYTQMTFNITAYARLLMDDFLANGGELHTRVFDSPRQFADLREKVVFNATGYGARALLGDETIVPVRGQTARLVPQPEVDYSLFWRGHNLNVIPRRDGILVQAQQDDDYGNEGIAPDRALSEAAVAQLAMLFAGAAT